MKTKNEATEVLQAGDKVKFHTPNPDEDANQVYELLDDAAASITHAQACGMTARVDIRALNTGLAIPPVQTVELDDLCAS